ncbi:MAG: tRNA (adenosine(37)-N6)-threonylcarbamoyltransferase complex transferase subunit TsaD [Pseudodesulfovibrio sp.]|jgi:N6-L-threonylcarbamoyladenine synthase|uniref:tRNA N6-adenosine threonylcarbamoyltransferase n=1 Tax=Pseudodesulfovibrio indicus TaxID=1716143 RepID=A0A126QPJ4_9BACT|nr:tRNA (adenosine(37)-N6)-threonylcarbamoyltransferase complex transferase subunit TsaD [Pseudodesulfovibrio indicus]AMK11980.1 tRNA threonylcarbamoyl adenosine modification protein TsaD [Pseudodesulfovibrio indicus]TDT87255.1 O-sialoglycoprotein endopeptidase [Pseudodesulfovibrio indicus]
MRVLGIETSCDETAVALVADGRLLGHQLATQVDMHALFGGVVPEIASREHLRVLPRLYRELLRETGLAMEDIDAVAVARGPGLLGSLLVGVSFAKGLCLASGARLVGVNHLWAHLLAPGLEGELRFPALGLLVSGGHTHTYLVRSPADFELLGRTLDDAAGEAFDKTAKIMNFPYPGGRYIDDLAREAEPDTTLFPRPYIDNPTLDFSFSGLKTAVANHVAAHPDLVFETMADADAVAALPADRRAALARVCASFNWSVADTLRIKVERALKEVGKVESLIVAGGVAANTGVREAMRGVAEAHGLELTLPSLSLCTDNGAMVAYAGWELARAGYGHGLDLEAIPRGRIVPLDWERAD